MLLLPVAALADGKVVPPLALPAKIIIPDQRALIHFSNGVERLVIETRFTGSGTNFAWVVPLPNQPVFEEASIGLFPTLQYLFRPRITHNVTQYYPVILFLAWLIYFVVFVRPAERMKWQDYVLCLLVGISVATIRRPWGGPQGVMLYLGLLAFLVLILTMTLARRVHQIPHALSIARWFFALPVLPFVYTPEIETPEDFGVWLFLVVLDVAIFAFLVRWRKVAPHLGDIALLAFLLAIQWLVLVGLAPVAVGSAANSIPVPEFEPLHS